MPDFDKPLEAQLGKKRKSRFSYQKDAMEMDNWNPFHVKENPAEEANTEYDDSPE